MSVEPSTRPTVPSGVDAGGALDLSPQLNQKPRSDAATTVRPAERRMIMGMLSSPPDAGYADARKDRTVGLAGAFLRSVANTELERIDAEAFAKLVHDGSDAKAALVAPGAR